MDTLLGKSSQREPYQRLPFIHVLSYAILTRDVSQNLSQWFHVWAEDCIGFSSPMNWFIPLEKNDITSISRDNEIGGVGRLIEPDNYLEEFPEV